MKTCCVTGHRDIPADKIDYVKKELRREIEQAIEEGYTMFISGMAEGTDLEFASIVAELKQNNSKLFLEAAIPYPGRLSTKNKKFQDLFKQCNGIKVVSQEYSRDCYFARNRYLVEQADRIIAVFDGRVRSGTAQTIRMSMTKGLDIREIKIARKAGEQNE